MTKIHIQMVGLICLSLLAGGLLGLIGYALNLMGHNISADGKVPVLDAGLFTASLLAFQQTVGAIRSVWESQERASMAENLQNSTPIETQKPAPQSAAEGAKQAADAATDEADQIAGQMAEGEVPTSGAQT
jgi:hypothetical protein